MSMLDGTVVVQLDLTGSGAVQGVDVTNNSTRTVEVGFSSLTASIVAATVLPGTTSSVSVPKGKQINASAEWVLTATLTG